MQPQFRCCAFFVERRACTHSVYAVPSQQTTISLFAVLQVYVEYESVEDRTFITGQPAALATFFGQASTAERRRAALDQCAQRLCTAFATLKSRPGKIVVRTPVDVPDVGLGDTAERRDLCRCARRRTPSPCQSDTLQHGVCAHLCSVCSICVRSFVHLRSLAQARFECACRTLGGIVQDRLSRWASYDPSLFTAPLCDLLIVDRGHDPLAPAVHPFHYASMAHDLADLRGGVFRRAPPLPARHAPLPGCACM